MLKTVNHIGVAVKNIEESLKLYRDTFGMIFGGIEEVSEQKVKVAFLEIGATKIELLESTSPDGPIAKFIEKKGEGIHHIAFLVGDIEFAVSSLKSKGYSLIDDKPRTGVHNTKIAFLHPKSTGGVLIELVERKHE